MNLRIFRWIGVVAMLLLVLSISATQEDTSAEILWDKWGVPHIYAEDNNNLFYGFGWAQMHNHANLILKVYAQARGEAAEYQGEGALESDIYIHTLGIPEQSQQLYDGQSEMMKGYLDAFTKGMNDYAAANPDLIDDNWEGVLPVSGVDVMADWLRFLAYFEANPRSPLIANAREWESDQVGSNAWAIAPDRSASGNAMLLVNPHLPWGDMFITMETHLISPDVNMYGAAFVGLPIIAYGFNQTLGWTMTTNVIDNADLFELTMVDEAHYLLDSEEKALEVRQVTVQVKQEDGRLSPQTFPVARSVHGAIIAQGGGKALAIRLAGFENTGVVEQLWDMALSETLEQFDAVMARLQIPVFNVIYADKDGNIMHLFNGLVPKHEEGDWVSWLQIQPGDDSSLIWDEYHSYEELPKVINPPTGWLQNANEPPWTNTLPPVLDPANYPAYMSAPTRMGFRPQTSARMLYEDDSITFEELVAYKHSTRSELADRVLDELLALLEENTDAGLNEAAAVLQAWDRHFNADSRGGVLFAEWWSRYQKNANPIFTTPFDITAEPFTTPRGLADTEAVLAALAEAVEFVEQNFGALDVPWGDVYRVKIGENSLPVNGADGELGVFRVVWAGPWAIGTALDADQQYPAIGGDGFIAVVEFGETPRAQVLTVYGNASQPNSPHIGDQFPLFMEQKLRDTWLTREEVEANLENRETLTLK